METSLTYRLIPLLFVSLIFFSILSSQEDAKLVFSLDTPVLLRQEVVVKTDKAQPFFPAYFDSRYRSRALITLSSPNPPGYTFELTLKDFDGELKVNNENVVHFSSNDCLENFRLGQLKKLIDKPIVVTLNKWYDWENEDLTAFTQSPEELLVIKEIFLPQGTKEIIYTLFALAGETLEEGDKYESPMKLQYDIRKIDQDKIYAVIEAKNSHSGRHPPDVDFSWTEEISGDCSWNRNHSLLFNLNVTYRYSGIIKTEKGEHPAKITIFQHIETEPFTSEGR